uniref:Armadillo repeat containing 5 n=1 Tax=Astyanax mexicanus TaxID=7994 RepID=A0A8B9KAK8_ASTMX
MAAQVGRERKHPKGGPASAREANSESVESSLSWCLAQLTKQSSSAERPSTGLTGADNNKPVSGREALVAIRTHHIKGGRSRIAQYQAKGGLPPLLEILRRPESSRKILDLALSILANCCTEKETRTEVRGGRHSSVESVENRAARALGNLAMDPEGSANVHSAGSRAQSAARALLYLSDTPANRLSLLSQGALSALAFFIAPEYPAGLRRASLRALHELTRGCGTECAREMSGSGAMAQLGLLASGEGEASLEELALKTLANLCSQGCLRPLVGSLGVIPKFAEEVKKDPLRSGIFFKALCLCCKEAVNRVKVKESGGLEVLINFLSAHQNHPFTRLAILACVDFVYDEAALEQLQELGLVPLLVQRLVDLARGEELSTVKIDASLSLSGASELMTSCFDSFDFPPPEGTLPIMPKTPIYQHPYHPEPWTPESPILLLLSRFSHATDPSGVLINASVISGLLYYLTHHQDPSSRCFRMLGRLSCNPNCLQALIRTGAVALIRHRLCLGEVDRRRDGRRIEKQPDRVKAKIRQLGQGLLTNVRVQSETGFGSGVLSHIFLSGSESDKLYCVLSLPLITRYVLLSSKLLLDSGGLLFALEPLSWLDVGDDEESNDSDKCRTFLSAWLCAPEQVSLPKLHSLYISLLIASTHNLSFLLDDGTLLTANREAIAGDEGVEEVGSEYFRALLRGGFGEAWESNSIPIRDVSKGMLLPVLHYLHGCRMKNSSHDGCCRVLTCLVSAGLKSPEVGPETFQKSPLAEVLIGASRFLVPTLQKEAEDLCISLLSLSVKEIYFIFILIFGPGILFPSCTVWTSSGFFV